MTQLKKAVLLEGFLANFDAAGNYSPIFRQHKMLSLPKFGHFLARKMAAGKSAPPSGTLLDFFAIVGACAMTTKFLDNKIFTFEILLS